MHNKTYLASSHSVAPQNTVLLYKSVDLSFLTIAIAVGRLHNQELLSSES